MRHRNLAVSVLLIAPLLMSGCAAGARSDPPASSPSDSPEQQAESAPTEPTIEITYEIDGSTETVIAHPDKTACSKVSLMAFSDSTVDAVVGLPAQGGEAEQIRAYVLDEMYVGFLGRGAAVHETDEDGSLRASVVGLEGTATLIEIPEGQSPSAGDLDLTSGVELPATLTATVVCPAD